MTYAHDPTQIRFMTTRSPRPPVLYGRPAGAQEADDDQEADAAAKDADDKGGDGVKGSEDAADGAAAFAQQCVLRLIRLILT